MWRLASAAVLVPAYYFLAKAGGLPYGLFILVALLWGGCEWLNMVNPARQKRVWLPVLLMLGLSWGFAVHADMAIGLEVCLISSLVFMVAFRLMKIKKPVLLSMCVSYLGAAILAILALRDLGKDIGFELTFFLCSTVWLTDTGAYFCGKIFRGAKLAPDISPGKTWAGFFGGLVGGQGGALLCYFLFHPADMAVVSGIACFLSLAAQCGDLFESWVKRQAGVKNSSALIPGHGGLLDRADALIMASLWLWVLIWGMNFDLSWWSKV